MKIWIKYAAGILIGILFALVAPSETPSFVETIDIITSMVVQFGRYSLYPLLFFSFAVAVYELRESKSLFRLGAITAGVISISSIFLAVIGLFAVLARNPSRIPIFVEATGEIEKIGVANSLLQLFPSSAFEALANGAFILPLCIFAGFAGAGATVDKNTSKPAMTMFDSLSRISYAVMTFFVDILSVGMIALGVNWMIQYRSMLASRVYWDFILLLLVCLFAVGLVLYPLILRLVCGKINPYRVLYAGIAPVIAAFFSGDATMTLPVLLRHANESMGVRRRVTSVTLPLFSVFARGGTALTVIISFVVILKSYSSLGIAAADMLWILIAATILSFFLGRFSSGGAYIALAALCSLYGRGFESGYLILKPAAFFIGSVAAALDALTAITGSYIIAKKTDVLHHRDLRFYI